MKIKVVQNTCIANIGEQEPLHIDKIKSLIEQAQGRRVAIDFGQVVTLGQEFLDFVKNNIRKGQLALYNVNSDLYVLMFIMNMDKYLNYYMSENDFLNDKQCIVNRKLRLCS